MNKQKWFYIQFLTPSVLCLLVIFLYPSLRTLFMSFFKAESLTASFRNWNFVGWGNYVELLGSPLFVQSLKNSFKIWIFGGLAILAFAMLFSVIITSGIKGKNFWKALIYVPHIINCVAMVTMWVQYAFNNQYGFFKTIFTSLHLTRLAEIQWTSSEYLFISMMIAYSFAAVGFYVLIMVAGIDDIPTDYYEAASIEGAGVWAQFFRITLPLLKDIIKRCVLLYSAAAIAFFVHASLFSFNTEMATVTPVVYMYDKAFGNSQLSNSVTDVGLSAAVGVLVMLFVLLVNTVLNRIVKFED